MLHLRRDPENPLTILIVGLDDDVTLNNQTLQAGTLGRE